MNVHFSGATLGLILFAALRPAVAATAPMPIAHKTTEYRVVMKDGKAESLDIMLREGGRVVFSNISNKREDIEDEIHQFSLIACSKGDCKKTCDYASDVRPALSVEKYESSGRLSWRMSLPKEGDGAIRLLSSGTDDCMSPNQKYLTVEVYFPDTEGNFSTRAMPAVIRLEPHGRFVRAKGLGSEKDGIIGWRAGRPATLVVEHDAGVVHDGPPEYVETTYSHR